MYLTLSPFFYYLANSDSINTFLIIELNGKLPQHEDENIIKSLIRSYINNNSHGVDELNIDKYVEYIYKHLN